MRNMFCFNILLLASLALAFGGCATPVDQRTGTYKTLEAVGLTVETAMTAYLDAVVAGRVPPDTQIKVKSLYGQYRVIYHKAIDVAKLDVSTAPPAEVSAIALQIVTLIASLTGTPSGPTTPYPVVP